MPDQILLRALAHFKAAEAPGFTDGQRARLNDTAAALVAEHGVAQALAHDAEPVTAQLVLVDAPYAYDTAALLGALARPLGCKPVHKVGRSAGRRRHAIELVGLRSDVERVRHVWPYVERQARAGLTTPVPAGENPTAWRRSWLAGYTDGIEVRFDDAERDAHRGAAVSPTVFAARTARVDTRFAELYPAIRETGRHRDLTGSGEADGYRAALDDDLDRG